jgi:DNA-binding XRE family transcriptional regulator
MDDLTCISIDHTKLRKAREDAGFTQEAAGEAVGVIKQTISNIECGVALPSANVLARLCALYGVDISKITNAKAA